MPSLTYNSVPLIFDMNREADEFLEKYQPLGQTILSGEFLHKSTWQGNPMDENNIGLPLVNWPMPPPLSVGALYWPCTGATRWAEGLFLCNGQAKNAIDSCTLAASGAKLRWDTDYNPQENELLGKPYRNSEWTMYPLAFRRVSGCREGETYDPDKLLVAADADDYDLYLLHLVDQRYWWQFVDAPDICEHLTSWLDLINYLTGELGVGNLPWALPDTGVHANYGTGPHQGEWMRASYNAAQLLDAALASIGCRLIAGLDYGFEISSHLGAEQCFLDNLGNLAHEQLAGTECTEAWTHAMPTYVNVAFPKSRFGMLCGQCNKGDDLTEEDCHESYHVIDHAITEYLDTTVNCPVAATSKTIHIRGWADMGVCGDSYPMNNAELIILANQIASDWFGYHKRQYDFTTVGPTAWDPCGYDDCIIHKFGIEQEDGQTGVATAPSGNSTTSEVIFRQNYRRDITSRIQSLPLNVGVDCQLHNTNALELPGHLICKTPEGGIAAPSSDTIYGELCTAYRVVGDIACGTLTREKITAIDSVHSGNDYMVMVYQPICGDVAEEVYIDTGPFQCCARRVIVECCDTEGTG